MSRSSVFLPTFDLPWWAAVIQVAAVLGVAELLLGRPGLTLVGGVGQFASTMLARVMIIYGAAVHIGLPLSQAGILDTGPSGITTAIGAWLLARRHAYATLALLMVALTARCVRSAEHRRSRTRDRDVRGSHRGLVADTYRRTSTAAGS